MKRPQYVPHQPQKPGFTLVELLTVMGIIAVLAAILIPVVGNMRVKSNMAVSVSNLRSLGGGALLYANDHSGEYPQGGYPTIVWHRQMAPYLDGNREVFADPGNESDYKSWVTFEDGESLPFDYGYNAHVNTVPDCPIHNYPYLKGPTTVFSVENPSGVPLMYTIARQNNFVSWCLSLDEDSGNDQAFEPRFNGQGNVVWLDGHVSSPTYQELMDMVDQRGGSVPFVTGRSN